MRRWARIADREGQAIIARDNKPKYVLVDLDSTPYFDMTDDEKMDVVAARIPKCDRSAFDELAK